MSLLYTVCVYTGVEDDSLLDAVSNNTVFIASPLTATIFYNRI